MQYKSQRLHQKWQLPHIDNQPSTLFLRLTLPTKNNVVSFQSSRFGLVRTPTNWIQILLTNTSSLDLGLTTPTLPQQSTDF
mmetsp:Transcript_3583/g.4149  ORF Transcript_3583/g.4149 Transcript_3583/m.4149 type:complete len:81 (-) Transcript_3583:549-791(-)